MAFVGPSPQGYTWQAAGRFGAGYYPIEIKPSLFVACTTPPNQLTNVDTTEYKFDTREKGTGYYWDGLGGALPPRT